jgi:putative transposase
MRTDVPTKRPRPEELVAKLRKVDVLVSQGKSVADTVRSIGTTEVTHSVEGGTDPSTSSRVVDIDTDGIWLRYGKERFRGVDADLSAIGEAPRAAGTAARACAQYMAETLRPAIT